MAWLRWQKRTRLHADERGYAHRICWVLPGIRQGGDGTMAVIASPCADGFPAQGRGNPSATVEMAWLRSQ